MMINQIMVLDNYAKKVIVVLGSPNSSDAVLSAIARSRLDYCAAIYAEGISVLCTGGWGDHFNTATEAHAVYAKRYLMEKGVAESAFLDFALSSNSVDDAVKVKAIISEMESVKLTVITSAFHLERARLIFQKILSESALSFVGVTCEIEGVTLADLIQHEKDAILSIQKNGLYY